MQVGEVLDGKYRVDRVLGEGGMGQVFAATHLSLSRPVAIKILRPEMLRMPGVVSRFLREARAAGRLHSAHVGHVIDVGELPERGPYIVMELLHGNDLASELERGPLSVHVAVGFVLEACEGLAEAHALGMVHRDIKPANLFLVRHPSGAQTLKVVDFGIATAARGDIDAGLTQTSSIIGSPHYMSPEQLRSSKHVDQRSDIWSLGVTLYELLSGRLPFDGEAFSGLAIAIATEPHVPLTGMPPALTLIVERCLAKNPAERFQTVSELALALAPWTSRGIEAANRVTMSLSAGPESSASISRASESTTGLLHGQSLHQVPTRSLRWPMLAASAVATAAVVAILLFVLRGSSSAPVEAASADAAVSASAPTPAPPPAPTPAPTPSPPPPPEPTLEHAKSLRGTDNASALAESAAVIAASPENGAARMFRAALLFEMGQGDAAMDELQRVSNVAEIEPTILDQVFTFSRQHPHDTRIARYAALRPGSPATTPAKTAGRSVTSRVKDRVAPAVSRPASPRPEPAPTSSPPPVTVPAEVPPPAPEPAVPPAPAAPKPKPRCKPSDPACGL